MSINVHNHGPNEGRGIDCGEPRLADDSPIGWCQLLPIIRKAEADAWYDGFNAGCAEAKDPDAFVNDPWDAKTPNPYTEDQ